MTGDDLVGQVLDGRYRVTGPLGEGGMATVWLAEDLRLSRRVVIKIPSEELLRDATFRERFQREVRSLVELEHPHIVKVLDAGSLGGTPYAVLPYLPGGSLKDRLDRAGGRLSPRELLAWLAPIAESLDFMHTRRYLHRDIKPGNILFDADGRPYLSDFGIAKALETGESELTRTGQSPGSPGYMPPEILGGRIGPAYDQYSLGAVVLRCLSGRAPPALAREGLGGSLAGVVGPAAIAVIGRAVALDPSARYPDCSAFARELSAALEGDGVRTVVPVAPAEPGVSAEATRTHAPGAERRRRWIVLVLAGCAVLAALAAWHLGRQGAPPPVAPPPAARPPVVPPPEAPASAGRIVVESPVEGFCTREPRIEVMGRVTGAIPERVEVSGAPAEFSPDGQFHAFAKLLDGPNSVAVVAVDREGSRMVAAVSVCRDSKEPKLTLEIPQGRVFTRDATIRVLGQATDANPLEVTVNKFRTDVASDGTFFRVVELAEGDNLVTVVARDAAGNVSRLDRPVTLDRTPPVPTVKEPPKEATGKTILVEGTVDEPGSTVSINGVPARMSGNRFKCEVTLEPGGNEVVVTARDRAGNESAPVTFRVLRK